MKKLNLSKLFIISILGIIMLLTTTHAEAWNWRHRYKHKHLNHDYYGKIVYKLPWGSATIIVGDHRYRYYDGHYYRKHPYGWKLVRAPRGVCITRLPRGYKKVYFGKKRYYHHNDVYYKRVVNGYEIVDDPSPDYTVVKNREIYADYDDDYDFESLTVNIPKEEGGYDAIELKREGEGFIGPQGEYYEEFPKIAQLKVIYDL